MVARILAWVLFSSFICATVVEAQDRRLDRDRNRRTGQEEAQSVEGRRQQLPQRQPQVVPRRPPPERFDRWVLGVSVTYDDTGAVSALKFNELVKCPKRASTEL